MKNLTELIYLNLSNTRVDDFKILANFSNLETLNISHNKVFNCKLLTNLSGINELNIINTKLTNFNDFKNFPAGIKKLSVNQNTINLENILPKLESIHFDFNNEEQLKQVIKYRNPVISFANFKGNFTFLNDIDFCKVLDLSNTNFNDLKLLKNQLKNA